MKTPFLARDPPPHFSTEGEGETNGPDAQVALVAREYGCSLERARLLLISSLAGDAGGQDASSREGIALHLHAKRLLVYPRPRFVLHASIVNTELARIYLQLTYEAGARLDSLESEAVLAALGKKRFAGLLKMGARNTHSLLKRGGKLACLYFYGSRLCWQRAVENFHV